MSRRCLICANYNPCSRHSDDDQQLEFDRNKAAIRHHQRDLPASKRIYP